MTLLLRMSLVANDTGMSKITFGHFTSLWRIVIVTQLSPCHYHSISSKYIPFSSFVAAEVEAGAPLS